MQQSIADRPHPQPRLVLKLQSQKLAAFVADFNGGLVLGQLQCPSLVAQTKVKFIIVCRPEPCLGFSTYYGSGNTGESLSRELLLDGILDAKLLHEKQLCAVDGFGLVDGL